MVKRIALSFVMLFSSAALAGGHGNGQTQRDPSPAIPQATNGAKKVDLVIALDTSSSMDGLIDAARQKLWDVVNLLSHAKPSPVLRVGIISYGNDGYDAKKGWVRKDAELTTNLDDVYQKLFALKTNGGSEYVARAVHDATSEMKWDQDQGTLKIIFVAGNEPANQDPQIPVERAVGEAKQKGIFVNAIYCGGDGAWEAQGWRQVALLGSGKYAAIDQNRVVAIATPMDSELAKLSNELNKTYVGYGMVAKEKAANQASMDGAAGSAGAPVAASRAAAKASVLYRNDEWDLVDARAHGKKDVGRMKAEELPAPMRAMDEKQRAEFLDKKAKDRSQLQQRIAELSGKRDQFIQSERKKQVAGPKTFDDAVTGSIRTEAESAGFAF
ncbi:MAG: von Willebrand factor type domain protein [Myxococcales bacterium]|nr:von Willebrand factor type domain protein [Myxococcales bacterium]